MTVAGTRHPGPVLMKQQGFGVEAANKKNKKKKSSIKTKTREKKPPAAEGKQPAKRLVAARRPNPATAGDEDDVSGFTYTGPLRPGVQSPRRMVS